jgi:hypothetical protein
LKRALTTSDLAKAAPPGTVGVLISYGVGAAARVPMGPIAAITAFALGSQLEYRKNLTSDLVYGVTLAADELDRVVAQKKVILIVGDGSETNVGDGPARIAELKARLHVSTVGVSAVSYAPFIPPEQNLFPLLTEDTIAVDSAEAFVTELTRRLQRLGR